MRGYLEYTIYLYLEHLITQIVHNSPVWYAFFVCIQLYIYQCFFQGFIYLWTIVVISTYPK